MAITQTTKFGYRKHAQYDMDWHTAMNQNWDDLDNDLEAISVGQVLQVRHTATAGTGGGDLNTTWTRRPLASVANGISGASVAGNEITLPAGTYEITGYAMAFECDNHRARLYNITDTATALLGSSARAKASYLDMSPSLIQGRITLAAQKVFRLEHIASVAKTVSGMGKEANLDSQQEIYADLLIRKLTY